MSRETFAPGPTPWPSASKAENRSQGAAGGPSEAAGAGVERADRGRRAPRSGAQGGTSTPFEPRGSYSRGRRPPTGSRGWRRLKGDWRAEPKIVAPPPRAPKMDGLLCERDVALGSTRTGRRIGTTAAEARYVCVLRILREILNGAVAGGSEGAPRGAAPPSPPAARTQNSLGALRFVA